MPLVVSHHSRRVEYRVEDNLFEILGHSNFGGADWAVGDLIIFEDGSESTIRMSPDCINDELYYDYTDARAGDFNQALEVIRKYHEDMDFAAAKIANWHTLFKYFKDQDTLAEAQQNKFNTGCMIALGIIILYVMYLFSP